MGDWRRVDVLLQGGTYAEPTGGGKKPLDAAILGGHAVIALRLLRACADPCARYEGVQRLYLAAERGDWYLTDVLLQSGAEVDAINDLSIPDERGARWIEDSLGSAHARTALHAAAASGAVEVMALLIEHGAQVDGVPGATDYTPLMEALARGQASAAAYLLDEGADARRCTPSRHTTMDLALRSSAPSTAVVARLLRAGAGVPPDALNIAAGHDNEALLQLLIEVTGAPLETLAAAALHAVRASKRVALEVLLRAGAHAHGANTLGHLLAEAETVRRDAHHLLQESYAGDASHAACIERCENAEVVIALLLLRTPHI